MLWTSCSCEAGVRRPYPDAIFVNTHKPAQQRDPDTRAAWMTADDVFRSVVPLFPPHDSDIIRSGSLWGEPASGVPSSEVAGRGGWYSLGIPCICATAHPLCRAPLQTDALPKAFAVLDLDGNGRIGFEEWLLFVSFLSLPSDEIEGTEGCGESGGRPG